MKQNFFARRKCYVSMFEYVWSMSVSDFEQLLLDGATGMYDRGLRDDWENFYNATLLRTTTRGGESERRRIFKLLDAETEDFEYALDWFYAGYYTG